MYPIWHIALDFEYKSTPEIEKCTLTLGPMKVSLEGWFPNGSLDRLHGPPHQLGQRKRIEAQYLDV